MTSLAADSEPNPAVWLAFPRALVRLCSRSQRQLWGLRLARLYGFGIGFSYAAAAFAGSVSPNTAAKLWARCLATASWVACVGALSLAGDLAARDATQGLTSLARLRGFGERELEHARTIAGAWRLSVGMLVPGLMLAVTSLARFHTVQGTLIALSLALFTFPYAVLVGGSLSVLARACQRWMPGRGRWLLLALVLGPWLLGSGLDLPVPSVPAAFDWLLQHLAGSFR